MKNHLDPVILQKLRAFAARRRSLIMLRGIFSAVAMLIATMVVVAAVDFHFFLSDWMRWALSSVAYGAVLVIAWRQCIYQLVHAPNERQIARLVEHAEPKLREDLLSAVELNESAGKVFDSEQFRELLRTDVSARMQGLEVKSLLPVALIKRSLAIVAVIFVAVLALMTISDFRLGALLLRALMPGANLDRVSTTQVVIVEPAPPNRMVAQGDAVRLVIKLEGQTAQKAMIETDSATDGRRVVELTPQGNGQFATMIQVGRDNVIYRIQAGDALTQRYQLTAVARPFEEAFEKTYHYPAYSKIPTKTVTESSGDLAALEGAEVELKIKVSQPVKEGELRMVQGANELRIPLKKLPDGRLTARFPMKKSGNYHAYLIAEQTGFENKYSPECDLRVIPDLIPEVRINEPETDIVSPADEVIHVDGLAKDDVGLAKISQWVKVNEGEWKEFVLKQDGGLAAGVEREWDLSDEKVKANDVIATKLVATDFNGSRAESRTIQIVVQTANLEMKRLNGLDSRRKLADTMKALTTAGTALEEAARIAHLKSEKTTDDADQSPKEAAAALATSLRNYESRLSEAWVALDTPLRDAPCNHESSDLVMLGRFLSRINSGEVQRAIKLADLINANFSKPSTKPLVADVRDIATHVKAMGDLAGDAYLFNLSGEQIDVVFEVGMMLYTDQRRVQSMAVFPSTPAAWEKISNKLRTVLGISKGLDGVLKSLKESGSPIATDAENILKGAYFDYTRADVEKALNANKPDEDLPDVFKGLNDHLGRVAWDARTARVRLAGHAMERTILADRVPITTKETPPELSSFIHQLLMQETEPTYLCIERLRQNLAAISNVEKLSTEERAALSEALWSNTGDIFRSHADLEEVRAVADNAFLAALRKASVVMMSLPALSHGDGAEKTAARLDVLDQSMRILEGGHNLQELADGMDALIAMERWEIRRPHARTAAPRDWAWIAVRIGMAPGQLSALDLKDAEARKAVDAAVALLEEIPRSKPFAEVMSEMSTPKRMKYGRSPLGMRSQLEPVAAKIRAALSKLSTPMDIARQNLASLTPKVSDLAAALAKEEGELKKDTNQTALKASTAKPADNADAARPQHVRQQQINTRIEMLKDLIRADANERSVLIKNDRERMRDAEDTLAMLKDPPPHAEQALLDVTRGTDAEQQQTDLDVAVEDEQKIVDVLNQIAGHYAALEQGKDVADSRDALRKTETDLGIKEDLDKQYNKAQQNAEQAGQSQQDQLNALEGKLPTSTEMRQELDQIARDAVAVAIEALERALKAETAAGGRIEGQILQDKDPNTRLSTLEAANLAFALATDAQTAAETARQLVEGTTVKPLLERAGAAVEKAAATLPMGAQLVQSAQRIESARTAAEAENEITGLNKIVELFIQAAAQSHNESNSAASVAKTEAAKAGELQDVTEQSHLQFFAAAEKSQHAMDAARRAQSASHLARERLTALATIPANPPSNIKLALAAREQLTVKSDTLDAAADAARAGRHAGRLGKSDAGQALSDIAAQIADAAHKEITNAEKAIRDSQQATDALPPVKTAIAKLTQLLQSLKDAGKIPNTSDANISTPSDTPPADQQQDARDLDALDQALNPSESEQGDMPPSDAPPTDTKPPMPSDADMPSKAGKMPGKAPLPGMSMVPGKKGKPMKIPGAPMPGPPMPPMPGEPTPKSEKGADLTAPGSPTAVADLGAMKKGEWGKLPRKLAEQLTKGQSETISADYQEAVQTYYRVIAEKARHQ